MFGQMKRKFHDVEPCPIVKTSISLPQTLVGFAQAKCAREGFATLSAYLQHLIRLDRERDEDKRSSSARPQSGVKYSEHQPQFNEMKEPKKTKPPKAA